MIVFDLRCGDGHVFEAWFASSAAYESQRADGLIACPLCEDSRIEKAVMAPNIAAKGNRSEMRATVPAPTDTPPSPEAVKAALETLAKIQAKALEKSRWVGTAFVDSARAMHLGEAPTQPIHGQATLADARALAEEGVSIAPLPFPVIPPETRN
ncbi:DUF1178 family protein [Sphingomonas sp.]|uniref:DUF1178 family protein n=1 Tax=Sphingomonas sp. TaxID=28214 RepID=UPI002CB60B75|nr:DUF1178 family protein [Sphingomonas sp.]HTG39127.1 DUF1178 family protein [Sphingomonas sp.]